MTRDIITAVKTLMIALLFVVGASYASAVWTSAPGGTAPNCPTDPADPEYREGCNPPINTGTVFQSKAGNLNVAGVFSAISGIFSGNVGIGTLNPTQALDVNGTVKTTGLQVTNGAAAGKVLTSDAVGNATWQAGGGGALNAKAVVSWAKGDNILYSYGISSVTLASGRPLITFSSPMSSSDYVVVCNATNAPFYEEQVFAYNKTPSTFTLQATIGSGSSEEPINKFDCVIFGN